MARTANYEKLAEKLQAENKKLKEQLKKAKDENKEIQSACKDRLAASHDKAETKINEAFEKGYNQAKTDCCKKQEALNKAIEKATAQVEKEFCKVAKTKTTGKKGRAGAKKKAVKIPQRKQKQQNLSSMLNV